MGAPTQRTSFLGSYIPFAKTAAERQQAGDPRPALAERYAGKDDYLKRYRAAIDGLVRQRFILAADLPAMLQRGAQEWDAVMKP